VEGWAAPGGRVSRSLNGCCTSGERNFYRYRPRAQAGLKSDRVIVEVAVRLLIKMRSKNGFTAAVASQLRCALASLGMTSSDRSRVKDTVAALGSDATLEEFSA